MRVMTEADIEAIGRYCAMWAEWKKNYEMVKRNGDVLTIWESDPSDPTGKKQRVKYMQPTPYATQMKSLATLLLRIEQEFGLTPSSRSQVTIHGRTEDDPLASFVQERSRGSGA
jgi:P27 family predicted phage terminase small subunit